jgi:putative ABC transport system permease protein
MRKPASDSRQPATKGTRERVANQGRTPWPIRLGRLLPADAEQDLYTPALHDLNAERRTRAGYARGVVWLFLDTLRLSVGERLTRSPLTSPGHHSADSKELFTMFRRDIRHALRLFVREPGFTATVILTLALGIGANTALFAIVEAVLLRPLPYAVADELAIIRHRDVRTGITKEFIAYGDFVDFQARQKSLAALAGYGTFNSTLVGDNDSVVVRGLGAMPNFLDVFRLQPALGRMFEDDDTRQGAQPVVLISHQLWQSRFASDPNIVGRSIQLGAGRRLIVGVAPRGFHFPPHEPTDVIVPMTMPAPALAQRKGGWILAIGRLRPGVALEAATAEYDALSQQFEQEYRDQNEGTRYYAVSLRDQLVGDTKRPLIVLLAAVGFVLLIACVNVGNLLLARSLARHTELALRQALGAGRMRLVAQLLTEGLVLAIAGAAVGLLVAWRTVPALVALVPRATPLPGLDDVGINPVVMGFALGASVLSAFLFSSVACVGLVRNAGRDALSPERRATSGPAARRAASVLVGAEVALAVVLLIAAGLTLRSFANLISVDPGFRAEGVMTMQVQLPPGRYTQPDTRRGAYDRLFAAFEAVPGVETVGSAAVTPLTGNNWSIPFERADRPVPKGERPPDVGWQAASGGYFTAMSIPLKAGRLFDSRDTPTTPVVVIISEAIQQLYFNGESPIGRQVRLDPKTTAEIVGVVGDIRRAALSDAPRADMYLPFEQQPPPATTLFIRTTAGAEAVVPSLRSTLKTLEPNAVVYEVRSLNDVAAQSAAVPNLAMRVLSGFALLALALSAVGIYGVMSYTVRRRGRELGTRLALGASRRDIMTLVLRQAALVVLVGITVGVAVGLAAARSLGALLYGVTPWDPAAIAIAATLLVITALGASVLPARRAAQVDPARTLTMD